MSNVRGHNATFGMSTLIPWLPRAYLIQEHFESLPPTRMSFMIGTALLGLLTTLLLLKNYQSILKSKFSRILQLVYISHFLSYWIHSAHYVDNIYRPSAYAEPKWLYQIYIFGEMEITFFINFPISILGFLALKNIQNGIAQQSIQHLHRGFTFMKMYIAGSLLTMGHYLTQPPSYYSAEVNFTIGGEGIATILLGLATAKLVGDVKSVWLLSNEDSDDVKETIRLDESKVSMRDKKFQGKGLRARTPTRI